MSGNLSLITFSSFLQSISLRNYETILRCVCDNTSYKILSLCIDKCQYLVSAFSRVWDYPKSENRAFRLTAGTLCFSGVGTHRICLPFYKEVGRAMSSLNQRQSNSSPTPPHQLPQISPPLLPLTNRKFPCFKAWELSVCQTNQDIGGPAKTDRESGSYSRSTTEAI